MGSCPPLAGHGPVVVIAEYRLGVLCDLALQELITEGHGSSGNYCLRDMIFALRGCMTTSQRLAATHPRDVVRPVRVSVERTGPASLSKGGGLFTSAAIEINVLPGGVPLVYQPLSPAAVAPGGAGFTLTVNGTGFVSGSTLKWNGSARASTFVTASELTASVQLSDIASANAASVTVVNPARGGGKSNAVLFEVTHPNEACLPFSSSQSLAKQDGQQHA